jgi:glyoxylase-like metal-dependent hydrolase (beta-lactamase superfamily II)/rhodanese-related sulfurtransferase
MTAQPTLSIETIETAGLGDHSYLAHDGEVAIVIDPQRDIDRVLTLIRQRGVRLTHVFETHIHNDYVTGGVELAKVTGASYCVALEDNVRYERQPVSDGDVITTGAMRIRVLHTPGHTHHHLSYALEGADGTVQGVFTGGSLLYGSTGRTDLVGPQFTVELTHAQFHSVRRLATLLPPETPIFPTHGFGSFCSATPTDNEASTIGGQQRVNPALTQDEQSFVDELIAGLDAYPAYYSHMAPINRTGPDPVDLSMPELVDPAELRRRIDAGEWVVDLRARKAFAAGHLAGSLGFELSDSFVTYLGWLYQWGAPITLVGEGEEQVLDARRELVRIGVDSITGAAVGDVQTMAQQPGDLRSYAVSDFAGLAERRSESDVHVLDTRLSGENAQSSVVGAQHIPIHELLRRRQEVPTGEVWIHCASGYRASVAASILDDGSRDLVLVDDDFDKAASAGLLDETVSAQ